MPVRAVRAERDDDLRPQAADVMRDPADRVRGVGLVEQLILVLEERDFMDAQYGSRRFELLLTDPRQRVRTGMAGIALRMAVKPAALAARRDDQRHLDAFGRVLRDHPAHAHRLVVGVCQHRQQLEPLSHGRW